VRTVWINSNGPSWRVVEGGRRVCRRNRNACPEGRGWSCCRPWTGPIAGSCCPAATKLGV